MNRVISSTYTKYVQISIEVLTICNLKCEYCYNRFKPRGYLSKPKLDLVLSQIEKINNSVEVTIIGGEPTLYRFLNYMLNRLYEMKNVKAVNIYSNGITNLKKIQLNKKCFLSFSYHEHQHNKQSIINNQKYLDSININYITIVMMENKIDITGLSGKLKPVFIVENGKTQYIKNELLDNNYVLIDNEKYSFQEFEKLNRNFKGYICFNREILVNLNLKCSHCLKTFDIRLLSNYINEMKEFICEYDECNHSNINIRKKDLKDDSYY